MARDWPWKFEATVLRMIDADTLYVSCDVGFGADVRVRVRVANIDAPERNTPEGRAAELYAMTLLSGSPWIAVETKFDRTFERYVARVFLADGTDFGERLVEAGHAVRRAA